MYKQAEYLAIKASEPKEPTPQVKDAWKRAKELTKQGINRR